MVHVMPRKHVPGHSYKVELRTFEHPSYEQRNEISNNVVFATSECPDKPVRTRSLVIAFASRLNIL